MVTQISSIQQRLNISYTFYSEPGLVDTVMRDKWRTVRISMKLPNDIRKRRIYTILNFHPKFDAAPAGKQRNQLARWTQCSDDLVVGIAAWDAFAGETSGAACKGVGSCRGGTGAAARTVWMDMLQAFGAKFEQTAAKANTVISSSSHVSMHQFDSICIINVWREPCDKSIFWMCTCL